MNRSDNFSSNAGNLFFLTFINGWQIKNNIEWVENRK